MSVTSAAAIRWWQTYNHYEVCKGGYLANQGPALRGATSSGKLLSPAGSNRQNVGRDAGKTRYVQSIALLGSAGDGLFGHSAHNTHLSVSHRDRCVEASIHTGGQGGHRGRASGRAPAGRNTPAERPANRRSVLPDPPTLYKNVTVVTADVGSDGGDSMYDLPHTCCRVSGSVAGKREIKGALRGCVHVHVANLGLRGGGQRQ